MSEIRSLVDYLKALLSKVVGEGREAVDSAAKKLSMRIEALGGRVSAEVVGRVICESIDAAMELRESGLSVDDRVRLGKELAARISDRLMAVAKEVVDYADLQEAVVRAKFPKDKVKLSEARLARNEGTDRVKSAMVDVVRLWPEHD